jgi:hypothetical protein
MKEALARALRLAAICVVFFGIAACARAQFKEQTMRLATFMSGEYLDAAGVVQVRASGNRVLLKRPLPAVKPLRDARAFKDLTIIDDPKLRDTAATVQRLAAVHRVTIRIIDECITARRMDEKFMNEVVKKSDAEVLKDLIDALEDRRAIDDVKNDIKDFVRKVVGRTYEVGFAQKLRADVSTAHHAALQQLWDRDMLDTISRFTGPAFAKPALEVARTKFVEKIPSGSVVVWRGLCVKNIGQQNLDNVTLALRLTASGNQTLPRTYFFPAFKVGQTCVVYMNDRAWGEVGYTGGADEIRAEVRVLCDQGRQELQTYALLQPTDHGHLARGAVKLVSADERQANIDAAGFFRALAAQRKSVKFVGDQGRIQLRFSEPEEPLVNMVGRVMVPAARYVRISMSGDGQKPLELDGHPEPSGKLDLLSHRNINGAVEPGARFLDRNRGSLTIEEGKIVLHIHKATYTAPADDTGIPLQAKVQKPFDGSGVLKAKTGATAPAKTAVKEPSLVGTWAATFKNGSKAEFTFTANRRFTGTNGAMGTWKQDGRKIHIETKTKAAPLVWEGELDADGQSLTATTAAGGRVTATRK